MNEQNWKNNLTGRTKQKIALPIFQDRQTGRSMEDTYKVLVAGYC